MLTTATALVGSPAFAAPNATTPVTVTVSPVNGSHVGSGFAGFSYEKDRIGAGLFDVQNTNLVRLFRLLGPNVLRIGGNEVDRINWNPDGAGGVSTEVAPSDVVKLAGFMKATGWKVIYGIDLKLNAAANAASEARFAASALGDSLQAFEIGNEPDFYNTQAQYEVNYSTYVQAIKTVVPDAVFDGPGQAKGTSWEPSFGLDEKANSLSILSDHTYIDSAANANIPEMLASTQPGGKLQNTAAAMNKARAATGVPTWRMTETNSFFNGGAIGVSDTEAASLWSLEYMAAIAANNGAGINFHGGSASKYTPIVFSGNTPTGVQGVYYGQLLWVLAGTGAFHAATVAGGTGVAAWGVGRNVFVDNESASPVTATIRLATPVVAGFQFVLTAPAPTSTATTIGGSSVGADATFTPKPQPMLILGHTATITVPANSAVLLDTL